MSTFSFSQISTYSSCPMKYKFEKIDTLKPEFEENLHLILGTTVHDTLEELYKKVGVFSIMSEEELISFFNQDRNKRVTKLETKTGQTHSIYTNDEIQSFHQRGIAYLETYYNKYYPFNQDKLFGTEQDVSFSLSDQISFRGKIDRLDMKGDTIIINDYKTNTKIPQDEKDKIQEQINLYGFGIKQLYASKFKNVIGRVYYLHFDTCYEREITDDLLQKVQEKYLLLAQEIEAKKNLYKKGNLNAFETKVGSHCEYCPFKVICPARKHQYMDNDTLPTPIDDVDSIRTLIDKYKSVCDEIKVLETKKDFYKEFLVTYAKDKEVNKLYSDSYKVNFVTKETYAIEENDEETAIQKLKEDGIYEELLKLDTNKFTKFVKEGKLDFDQFEDLVEHKETMYIHSVSEKKDKDAE